MARQITLLDGATGTCLWSKSGDNRPVWIYNMEMPDIVRELHAEYIAAGARIISANTFCANAQALKNSGYSVGQIVSAGVRLAKEAAAGTDAKVALDVGPLTSLLKPFGEVSHEQAAEIYAEQIGAGIQEKPDYIFLETFMDLEMISIALAEARKFGLPVLCSMSFTKFGKTLMGNPVKKIAERLAAEGAFAVGLNCSLGPDAALPVIRQFAEATSLPLIFKPNAGLPSEDGDAAFDAETFADDVMAAVDAGADFVGGCCGTNPAYIAKLHEKLTQSR
jgi:5-methyltetrahydrofolate--homocysteine methyltransferase